MDAMPSWEDLMRLLSLTRRQMLLIGTGTPLDRQESDAISAERDELLVRFHQHLSDTQVMVPVIGSTRLEDGR